MSIKGLMKKAAREYFPHKYMMERRERQKIEILKSQDEPLVYNRNGEIKRVFYLKDTACQHTPYTMVWGQNPDYILWDRNNVGLPIQFYTCENINGKVNKYARKNMALFNESEVIRPNDYEFFFSHPEIARTYDKIFCFSDRILDKFENAVFAPASGLWYGTDINGGIMDPERYKNKTKDISVICSKKAASEYHKIRLELSKKAVDAGLADGYGPFFDKYVKHKADTLDDYRFSIVVENDVKSYYFTEKILDCFASMTIPIYVGATKIGDYFNTDGIIQLEKKDYDKITDICKSCTKEEYEARKDAIIDNYNRAKEFRCIEDYIYLKYKNVFE